MSAPSTNALQVDGPVQRLQFDAGAGCGTARLMRGPESPPVPSPAQLERSGARQPISAKTTLSRLDVQHQCRRRWNRAAQKSFIELRRATVQPDVRNASRKNFCRAGPTNTDPAVRRPRYSACFYGVQKRAGFFFPGKRRVRSREFHLRD
jgi:hypothetical protein